MLFVSAGCEADVDVKVDGYLNLDSKAPSATDSISSDDNTGSSDGYIPEKTDDGSGNFPESTNGEPLMPQSTSTPSGDSSSFSPSATTPQGTGVGNTETVPPTSTSGGGNSSAPSSTKSPFITPTKAPVITKGPENYYVLTLDNGGGGGYVYINQGVDSETGEPGATNVNKGWFAAGTLASISAVPYEGCTFGGWYMGDDFVSPEADYTFNMPAQDYPLKAVFIF